MRAQASMTGHRGAIARAGAEAPKAEFSLISNEKLISLYSTMLKCRLLDERLRSLSGGDRPAASYCSAEGREAAIVGVAIDLRAEDTIRSSGPELIAGFVKGAPLCDLVGRLNSPMAKNCSSRKAKASSSEGTAKLLGESKTISVAAAFFADSSGDSSARQREMRLASKQRLPVLFISYHRSLSGIARGTSGLPSIPVDGNDVVAVYRVASEAMTHARKGNGPTLIQCVNVGSKPRKHPATTERRPDADPIATMEDYLRRKGLFRPNLKKEIVRDFARELDAAFAAAESRSCAAPTGHPRSSGRVRK